MTEVADIELCRELYELSGWQYDERHHRIEKVWIESFSTSEMGMGHEDYDKTPPEERRQYHVGEYVVRDNPKNFIGVPEDVPWGWANRYYEETIKRSVPAYTAGYLLRKLPAQIDSIYDLLLCPHKDGRCMVGYYEPDGLDQHETWGVTPENALTKLAIQLFKDNILRKDG